MRVIRRLFEGIFIIICLWMVMPATLLAEDSTKVGILYPQVKNPVFARVFDEIVDGVKHNSQLEVIVYNLSENEHSNTIKHKLLRDGIKVVIALGQRSYAVGQELVDSLPVVHGGVMIEPNGHAGISLVIDPQQFFSHLIQLAPSVKRVHTVYSEESNGWLMDMAREAASDFGIELLAHRASSLREGMHNLRSVLHDVEDERDAVWLLLDRVMPDKTALPLVLEKAWDQRIVVFSNNPSHTRRGALFSLFPDHFGMGIRLGELAIEQSHNGGKPNVLPSQDLKISVNERTASHLGFTISQSQRSEFDLIYPVQ